MILPFGVKGRQPIPPSDRPRELYGDCRQSVAELRRKQRAGTRVPQRPLEITLGFELDRVDLENLELSCNCPVEYQHPRLRLNWLRHKYPPGPPPGL